MWKHLRKRVSNFFFEYEYEEQDEEEKKGNRVEHPLMNDRQVKARMTYQYPKKSPFRFPVIPDDSDITQKYKKQSIELPAYKRRKSPVRQTQTPKKEVKKPFTPSRVASPIYGYQKREREKDVENIPTYLRKKNQCESKPVVEKSTEISDNRQAQIKKDSQTLHPTKNEADMSTTYQHDKHIEKTMNHIEEAVTLTEKESDSIHDKSTENTTNERTAEVRYERKIVKSIPHYLLNDPKQASREDVLWVNEQQRLLERTLKHFNVRAQVVNATQGPSVTRFEVQPELGVKVSKIKSLTDDIKLNMAAKDIRIEAPIPGKNTIGIEVPNRKPQMVVLQEILQTEEFKKSKSPLTVALGLTIEGEPLVTNIGNMPHGLIAGATGSGKSVCINTILLSLIYKASYEDVKFLLIDPKMVELAPYNGIPHLVAPVITDVKAATAALKWAVNEMEERYEKFVENRVRDIEGYNEAMLKRGTSAEKMPFIVIVIDELADLMMVSPQDVEDAISRIAQKARACGIHLLLATQRPSVDVITGLIKANIPTRIAFSVSSQVDSRTIIDTSGAEKLLGKGDMLFVENGSGNTVRLQGPFVSDEEIDRVTSYVRKGVQPEYLFQQEQLLEVVAMDEEDELLDDVIQFVFEQNQASTSLLQRQFRIGYNRAARLIDALENKGIISEQNGSRPRDVLISKTQFEEIQNKH